MKIVALIDDRAVIERILRHLGMLGRRSSKSEGGWEQGERVTSATGPPRSTVIERWLDDPFPDYDADQVDLSSVALA
jgi:hypothetical protein